MNQQANDTIEYLTSEDAEDQDFFEFADLNLTDEQLAEIKGGPGSGWCTHCTVVFNNHNETTVNDDIEADDDFLQFADLNLTDEQLAEIKGGPWCSQCLVVYSNHNETTVNEDSEAKRTEIKSNSLRQDSGLADLEPSGEIKGGPTKRIWDYIRSNN